jgi:hypothetical protein
MPYVSSLAILAASPALAQVSAVDLWAEWQATSATIGSGDDGTDDRNRQWPGARQLHDAHGGRRHDVSTGQLDRITMTEMPDGSVSIEISNPYTATIMFPEDVGGPMITVEILMNHEGLEVLASGTPDARSYVYSADAIIVSEGTIAQRSGRSAAHHRHGNHRARPHHDISVVTGAEEPANASKAAEASLALPDVSTSCRLRTKTVA